MTRIVTMMSGKGGVGKSTLTALLGALFAAEGLKVTLVDGDLYTPGLHALFGQPPSHEGFLDLMERRPALPSPLPAHPGLSLLQGGSPAGRTSALMRDALPVQGIPDALLGLATQSHAQILLVDTHSGPFEASLLAACVSDLVLVTCLAEPQHLQAAASLLAVLGELGVNARPVVNRVSDAFDLGVLETRMAELLGVPPLAVLPDSAFFSRTAGAAFPPAVLPADPLLEAVRDLATRIRVA